MKTHDIKNLPMSVHDRLRNLAQLSNRPYQELLEYYAMERFLYRLSQSHHVNAFVLKGALMFVVWGTHRFRPTRDIDLLGQTDNAVNNIVEIVKYVCNQAVQPDGLAFLAETVAAEQITEGADYVGVRVTFRSQLGTARIPMQIDIGFADAVTPAPVKISYPTLLDMPAPQLRGYPRETAIAEKLHAMVTHGQINTRMKDFYDIWLLSQEFDFVGLTLAQAIGHIFERRDTPVTQFDAGAMMAFAVARQSLWLAFLKRSRITVTDSHSEDITDFRQIVAAILNFLAQPVAAASQQKQFPHRWSAGSQWVEPE